MRAPPSRPLGLGPWWLRPALTGGSLAAFIVYGAWAVFRVGGYHAPPCISPPYAPCLAAGCGEAASFPLVGGWWRLSPALLVAWVPVGFRLTCYHYRKAYYRAFFWDPPACKAEAQRKDRFWAGKRAAAGYGGERGLFALNNARRYFWAAGVLVALVLTYDAVRAFGFPGGWGVGLGSLIFASNALAFWLWALGRHSCRHVVGGRLNSLAKRPLRYRFWTFVSALNRRHGLFAWVSLPAVVFTDAYVRLVASGLVTDPRFL